MTRLPVDLAFVPVRNRLCLKCAKRLGPMNLTSSHCFACKAEFWDFFRLLNSFTEADKGSRALPSRPREENEASWPHNLSESLQSQAELVER